MSANGKNRSLWVEAWPEQNWGLDLGVSIDLGSNLNAFKAYRTITESRCGGGWKIYLDRA